MTGSAMSRSATTTKGRERRIGLRTKWTIATAGGQVWQPYFRANLWRDWGAEADTVYSGADIAPLLSQTTMLELGGLARGPGSTPTSLSSPMSIMNSRSRRCRKRETKRRSEAQFSSQYTCSDLRFPDLRRKFASIFDPFAMSFWQ